MTLDRWQSLMREFGFPENQQTYDALLAAYSESHRFYHNVTHVAACLRHLDAVKALADNPAEIELALWFHDAIYKPTTSDNELASANWAKTFLIENEASKEVVDRVINLIMATLHNAPANTVDEALLVDIDLSILGAPPTVYDEFEVAVRNEYKWVPYFLYKKKRKEVLQEFFDRDRIYSNDYFFELLEIQAKANLHRVISG